jgi:hypothetical protein
MFAKTWKALLVMLFGVMLIAPQNSVSAAPVGRGSCYARGGSLYPYQGATGPGGYWSGVQCTDGPAG